MSSSTEKQERIRVRAYHLWEKAGCPHGDDLAFWHAAEKEEETTGGDARLTAKRPRRRSATAKTTPTGLVEAAIAASATAGAPAKRARTKKAAPPA